MQFIATFEIESDASVVSDDIQLKLEHPKGQYQARISNIVRKDYSTPFMLSVKTAFEGPSLEAAKNLAQDRLVDCLDMLAFVTGAGVRRYRIKHIVDGTPDEGIRECLIWADSLEHEDPNPILHQNLMASIQRLLQNDPPPAIRRALRWFRIGINESIPDDQFQYFWFALEILAEHQKAPDKVPDRCPRCNSPLYCEKCKTQPTHRPYAKQAIRALIQAVDKSCDWDTVEALEKARNALMHGATLKEIKDKILKSGEELVDVLGQILFKALLHQFARELNGQEIEFGIPTTYIHRIVTGVAHISTIVPKDENGELNLDIITGLKVTVLPPGPPQSGLPSIVVMTPDQHERLESLSREKGDHQELCQRVYEGLFSNDGQVFASVLSTDMALIQESLRRGETGNWQDLFREIMSNNTTGSG